MIIELSKESLEFVLGMIYSMKLNKVVYEQYKEFIDKVIRELEENEEGVKG
jgi:hypothetical protein